MTFQGGDFGEEGHDEAKQPPQAPEARPWEEFAPPAYAGQPPPQPEPHAPQDPPPSGPVPPWNPPTSDYPPPGYPPPGGYGPPGYQDAPPYGGPPYPPPSPQYGQSYPPPGYAGGYGRQSETGYGGPVGYGGPAGYPGAYDPYQPYQARSLETNGLAIGSLVTSIVGLLLGGPLTFVCYLGLLIPVVGVVLGVVALGQIKRNNQQGRGLAIAGIAVGATAVVLLVLIVIAIMASSLRSPTLR
jgi:Domain of unknown function (DUF4190)